MSSLPYLFPPMLAFGFVLFACTSTDHAQLTDQQYDDLAQHVGSTTANPSGGEVGSMQDTIDLSVGVMPRGLSLEGNGHFGGSRAGVIFDYTLACSDANGALLPVCNGSTDKADVQLSWAGSLALPNLTASVSRNGHWTLSSLTTDHPRLDGDGSFTFDSDVMSIFHGGEETTYHLAYTATYDDVVFEAHVPVSGSVHYTIDASSSRDGSFEADALITFTGSGEASLVLDGDHTYQIDLATGAVLKAGA